MHFKFVKVIIKCGIHFQRVTTSSHVTAPCNQLCLQSIIRNEKANQHKPILISTLKSICNNGVQGFPTTENNKGLLIESALAIRRICSFSTKAYTHSISSYQEATPITLC